MTSTLGNLTDDIFYQIIHHIFTLFGSSVLVSSVEKSKIPKYHHYKMNQIMVLLTFDVRNLNVFSVKLVSLIIA